MEHTEIKLLDGTVVVKPTKAKTNPVLVVSFNPSDDLCSDVLRHDVVSPSGVVDTYALDCTSDSNKKFQEDNVTGIRLFKVGCLLLLGFKRELGHLLGHIYEGANI